MDKSRKLRTTTIPTIKYAIKLHITVRVNPPITRLAQGWALDNKIVMDSQVCIQFNTME